jgi:hypothetical protein
MLGPLVSAEIIMRLLACSAAVLPLSTVIFSPFTCTMSDSSKQMAEITSKHADKEDDNVVQLETPVTAEEEKRVLRKIDCTLLPLMCLVFFFQYIDKQGLSYGSVFGLIPDLHLTPNQYSWCASIFYFGMCMRWQETTKR